jgi:hypothetical protein
VLPSISIRTSGTGSPVDVTVTSAGPPRDRYPWLREDQRHLNFGARLWGWKPDDRPLGVDWFGVVNEAEPGDTDCQASRHAGSEFRRARPSPIEPVGASRDERVRAASVPLCEGAMHHTAKPWRLTLRSAASVLAARWMSSPDTHTFQIREHAPSGSPTANRTVRLSLVVTSERVSAGPSATRFSTLLLWQQKAR